MSVSAPSTLSLVNNESVKDFFEFKQFDSLLAIGTFFSLVDKFQECTGIWWKYIVDFGKMGNQISDAAQYQGFPDLCISLCETKSALTGKGETWNWKRVKKVALCAGKVFSDFTSVLGTMVDISALNLSAFTMHSLKFVSLFTFSAYMIFGEAEGANYCEVKKRITQVEGAEDKCEFIFVKGSNYFGGSEEGWEPTFVEGANEDNSESIFLSKDALKSFVKLSHDQQRNYFEASGSERFYDILHKVAKVAILAIGLCATATAFGGSWSVVVLVASHKGTTTTLLLSALSVMGMVGSHLYGYQMKTLIKGKVSQ